MTFLRTLSEEFDDGTPSIALRVMRAAIADMEDLEGRMARRLAELETREVAPAPVVVPTEDVRPLADVEREHILRVVRLTRNKAEAASRLGISNATLHRRLSLFAANPAPAGGSSA